MSAAETGLEIALVAILALIWVCLVLICMVPAASRRPSAESNDKDDAL